MSTLQEILDDARYYMDDKSSKPQYSNRILLRALNAFGSEIKAINQDISLSDGFTTSQGTWEYSFPIGMWYPVRVACLDGNTNYPITILDPANFADFDFRSGNMTGVPRYLSVRDKKFVVYPTPDGAYDILFDMIAKWTNISEDDLSDDFEDYFDESYEKYAINYIIFNSLKSNNELTEKMWANFYRVNGDWERIKSLETMKYKPFNAMNRRTAGVVSKDNYTDYGRSI
jgi:hypothetical protein